VFIRFVIPKRDCDSHVELGLIQAADELLRRGQLTYYAEACAQVTLRWFNWHLPVPTRFARSRRRGAQNKAISWFKPTARACIRQMQVLATLLHDHGYCTQRLTTDRPGYVVYEDEYQIVAEAFRGER
jgi:hypothetical protein